MTIIEKAVFNIFKTEFKGVFEMAGDEATLKTILNWPKTGKWNSLSEEMKNLFPLENEDLDSDGVDERVPDLAEDVSNIPGGSSEKTEPLQNRPNILRGPTSSCNVTYRKVLR